MRRYFHAATEHYSKLLKAMTITVLMPLAAICVFCVVNIILNLREGLDSGLILLLLIIITGCVFIGMVFEFSAVYIIDHLKQRHSRYTYFDIVPSGLVFSLYAGEHYVWGCRVVYRRLYYIPFEGLEAVERDKKKTPLSLTIKGKVRGYLLHSDALGYHITEEGELTFDHPELDERGFEELPQVEIRRAFGSTRRLERSVLHYWEEYKNAPPKKEFNIADHIAVKRYHRPKTSNPLLEGPSFDRKW